MEGERQPEQPQQPQELETTEPAKAPETPEAKEQEQKEPEQIEAPLEQSETAPEKTPEKTEGEVFVEDLKTEEKAHLSAVDKLREISVLEWGVQGVQDETRLPLPETIESALSSNELKQQVDNAIENTQALLAASENLAGGVASINLEAMRRVEIKSEQDAVTMTSLLDTALSAIRKIKENLAAASSARAGIHQKYQRYVQAKLQEAGFSSFTELNFQWDELSEERRRLKGQFLGSIRNRAEIKRLEQEKWSLNDLIRLSYESTNIPMSRLYDLQSSAAKLIAEVFKITADKIRDRYETLLQEAAPEREPLPTGALAEAVDSLNDDFIQKYVFAEIEAKKNFLLKISENPPGYGYDREAQWLSDQEKIEQTVALLKKAFATKLFAHSFDDTKEEREVARTIREAVDKLPHPLGTVAESFIHFSDRVPANFTYQKIADFLNSFDHKKYQVTKSYDNLLFRLRDTSLTPRGSLLYNLSDLRDGLERKREEFRLVETQKMLDTFIRELDVKRWKVFKDNPLTQEIFGKDNLARMDRYLGWAIAEELTVKEEHRQDAIELGYKLFEFPNPETIPIAVMNAYREPGYSGEYPFLQINNTPENTKLFRFIGSLSQTDLTALEKKEIPGLAQVIDLIRQNPQTFVYPKIYNRDTGESKENPVYDKIEAELIKVSLYYLKGGDPKMQFYVTGLLKRLDFESFESRECYETISKVLREATDPKLQDAIMELVLWKADRGDRKIVGSLLGIIDDRTPPRIMPKIKDIAPRLIGNLAAKTEVTPKELEALSAILGLTAPETKKTLEFLSELKTIGHRPNFLDYDAVSVLENYVKLANNQEVMSFIKEVLPYGYEFNISHAPAFPEIIERRSEIILGIKEILKTFPSFRYSPVKIFEGAGEKFVCNPYDVLAYGCSPDYLFEQLHKLQEEQGSFPQEFSDGLMRSLRGGDPLLKGLPETQTSISEERYKVFYRGLSGLIKEVLDPAGKLVGRQAGFFFNPHLLRFIGRQPERAEEVMKIQEAAPHLFELLREGGPLYTNRDNVIRNIFENGDAVRRAREVQTIFTGKGPYWRQLYFFTDARIGEQLAAATTKYPISDITGVPVEDLVARHRRVKTENPEKTTRLQGIVKNQHTLAKLVDGEIQTIPFADVSGMYKRLIFRDYLRRTIETSRSKNAKDLANANNRKHSPEQITLTPGLYIHGSPIDQIESVLLNGNLPHEALGEGAATDAYPFHVDFTKLHEEFIKTKDSPDKILTESLSGQYGQGGKLGSEGQIFYLYRRDETNWERDKEYRAQEHHALMLGGMPATEIGAIILRAAEKTVGMAKRAVLENGFYIPIYDLNGRLLFTKEDYDKTAEDQNLSVPVEVWGFSLKTGEQLGSNPGGEFTVPTKRGPVKYYVKFSNPEETDHVWNEQLADNIYRHLGMPVPDTKIVKVEGKYGHASEILPVDPSKNMEDLKNGFLVDALLANWDVPHNTENTIAVEGKIHRIDNGGALLFRARGQRKDSSLFGEEVRELETGAVRERLGLGMRQEYPGLTDADIEKQAMELKKRLTDEAIDQLVDGVRLSGKDRDFLKRTLKARRDFILKRYP